MQEFAKSFYSSMRWQNCRKAYKKSVGGLCERCLKKGLYHPAVVVHHKVYLNPENINNPEIALNFANLEALCAECHAEEHSGIPKRYTVDMSGAVVIR